MAMVSDDCTMCGNLIEPETLKQTGTLCAGCRETNAQAVRMSWCVAGINKSNLMLITDREILKQLNPKRTEV
jgi:hypothetical protein